MARVPQGTIGCRLERCEVYRALLASGKKPEELTESCANDMHRLPFGQRILDSGIQCGNLLNAVMELPESIIETFPQYEGNRTTTK